MTCASFKFAAIAGATALDASMALACPLCHSPTGEKVREGIFNSDFPGMLFAMAMPFVVIAGVVAVIHHSSPHIAKGTRASSDSNLREGSHEP